MAEIFDASKNRVRAGLLFEAEKVVISLLDSLADMRTQGLAESVIKQQLSNQVALGSTAIQGFLASAREKLNSFQQKVYVAGQVRQIAKTPNPETEKFMWNAVGVGTCKDCISRHGRILTLSEWRKFGLPGSGATVCKFFCRCTLLPVDDAKKLYFNDISARRVTDDNLELVARSPILAKNAELKKQQKKRGKDYADSTFAAKLGNFKTEKAPSARGGFVNPAGEKIKTSDSSQIKKELDSRQKEQVSNIE